MKPTIAEELERHGAACKSIVEECDEWKRIAQGTSEGRVLADTKAELEKVREHMALHDRECCKLTDPSYRGEQVDGR